MCGPDLCPCPVWWLQLGLLGSSSFSGSKALDGKSPWGVLVWCPHCPLSPLSSHGSHCLPMALYLLWGPAKEWQPADTAHMRARYPGACQGIHPFSELLRWPSNHDQVPARPPLTLMLSATLTFQQLSKLPTRAWDWPGLAISWGGAPVWNWISVSPDPSAMIQLLSKY